MYAKKTVSPWRSAIIETKKKLVDNFDLKKGHKVLVLCCGIGTEAFLIKDKVGEEGYVLGIDINKEAIEIALQRKKKYNLQGIDFLQKNAKDLDAYFNMFDRVCCIFGMHYFEDWVSTIDYWSKCLKKGGILALAEWQKSHPNNIINSINNVIREYLEKNVEVPSIKIDNKAHTKKLKNLKTENKVLQINLEFEIPYNSPREYWEIFKNNDLFFRLKTDIGDSKFVEMERDILNLIEEFDDNSFIEIGRVRIVFIYF